MPLIIGDGSSAPRTLTNLVIGDAGGVARDLKELWIGDASGVARKIFSKGIVSVPTGNVIHIVGAPTIASAGLSFRPDGQIFYNAGNNALDPNWFTPATTDVGAAYWIRNTVIGGGGPNSGAATGVWLQLNIARGWSIVVQNGNGAGDWLIQIATDAAGSNIVASGTVSVEAESAF